MARLLWLDTGEDWYLELRRGGMHQPEPALVNVDVRALGTHHVRVGGGEPPHLHMAP